MHFRFVVHINWPGSQTKPSEGSCVNAMVVVVLVVGVDVVVVVVAWLIDKVINDAAAMAVVAGEIVDVVVAFIAVVCVIGDFDRGVSDEPVKDWSVFTQNISHNSQFIHDCKLSVMILVGHTMIIVSV